MSIQVGKRHQRSRAPGARMPEDAIYVGRGRGRAGRFGNPFRVAGAAATALAAHFNRQDWKARQWAAARLYALWLVDQIGTLPAPIAEAARVELLTADPPRPPSIEEIRAELAWKFDFGRDVVCWCPLGVDCHGDVLRAVAIGRDPLIAAGSNPNWADNFRCVEEQRARKRTEIQGNISRRGYVKGWTAW